MVRYLLLLFAAVLWRGAVCEKEQTSCPCLTETSFEDACNAFNQHKDLIEQQTPNLACYCLCPKTQVQVMYPFKKPSGSDKYRTALLNFWNQVVQHSSFANGGIVFSAIGNSSLSPEIQTEMFAKGSPLVLHAALQDEPGQLQSVFLMPDVHFLKHYESSTSSAASSETARSGTGFLEKERKCFWRGPASSEADSVRQKLITMSKGWSWMDASVSSTSEHEFFNRGEHGRHLRVSESEWDKYRCVLDVDESSSTMPLLWHMSLGAAVMRVVSPRTNAYTEAMRPWVHYIPIAADLSDLKEKTALVTQSEFEGKLQSIANNARALADRFSYAGEVARLSSELATYWIDSSIKSQAHAMRIGQDLYVFHRRVVDLLEQVDERPRRVDRRFPNTVRYQHSALDALIPPNLGVHPMMVGGSLTAIPSPFSPPDNSVPADINSCISYYSSVPKLPTLASPLEPAQLKMSDKLRGWYSQQPEHGAALTAIRNSVREAAICSNELTSTQSSRVCRAGFAALFESPSANKTVEEKGTKESSKAKSDLSPPPMSFIIPGDESEPTCSDDRHLIFVHADRFHCNFVATFLRTLRDAKSCAKVVFITDLPSSAPRPCAELEAHCGAVDVLYASKFLYYSSDVAHQLMVLEYLGRELVHSPMDGLCTQVLIVELDSFFQRNPFDSDISSILNAEVLVTTGGYNSKDNTAWTFASESRQGNLHLLNLIGQQVLGRSFENQFADMPLLNSGLTFGSLFGVMKMYTTMAWVADMLDAEASGRMTWQALLHFAYYTGLLSSVVQVRVLPPSFAPMMSGYSHHPTLQRTYSAFDPQRNPMLNELDQPYWVIHAFSQFHMMTMCEDWVLEYAGMDWKFAAKKPFEVCEKNETRRS